MFDFASLGSVASAFGIGGDDGPGFMEQYNNNRRMVAESNRSALEGKFTAAQQNGLHKLSVLGSGSLNSPSVHYNSSKTPDLNAMGQGIDRALNVGRNQVQRKLDELAIEKAKLSNDYLRTQIAGAQKQLLQTGSTVVPPAQVDNNLVPGSPSSGILVSPSRSVASSKIKRGVEAAVTPANKIYVGYDGSPVLAPASEYSESLEGNWPVGMLQNFFHNTVPWYHDLAVKKVRREVTDPVYKKFKKWWKSRYK